MKKLKIVGIICAIILCVVSMTVGFACSKTPELKFNENLNAEIKIEYNPQITVENGELVSVVVRNDNGAIVELGKDYSFIPQNFGKYYYTVTVIFNGEKQEIVKTVSVVDTLAPKIEKVLTEAKVVELGVYSEFVSDLEEIEVSDNNVKAEGQITKKVISVSGCGVTFENNDGIKEVYLTKAGEYSVKVEVSDVSGNVAYAEYKISAIDTIKPEIKVLEFSYAWQDSDGMVKLPNVTVGDVAEVAIEKSAKIANVSCEIIDGKVKASVSDVIDVTYIATDASGNSTEKTVSVKVLRKGQLFDLTDEKVADLFTAEYGIVENVNGLSLVETGTLDTFKWKNGAYTMTDVSDFKGLSINLTNNRYAKVDVEVIAKIGFEKKVISGFTLPAKQATAQETVYIVDLTKLGLSAVDGWELSFKSTENLNLNVNSISLDAYPEEYVQVEVKNSYEIGEALNYRITHSGNEIYESSLTVKKGSEIDLRTDLSKKYTFESAGTYSLEFAFDFGNKIFTTKTDVTVSGVTTAVSLNRQLTGGRVNEEYVLPEAQAGGKTVSVSLSNANGSVNITDGKFTPTVSGKYTVTYSGVGIKTASYDFYIEAVNEIGFETSDSFNFKNIYDTGISKSQSGNYVASGKTSAKAEVRGNKYVGVIWSNPIQLNGTINYVSASVYANLAGDLKIGVLLDGEANVISGGNVVVEKGQNIIGFLLGENVSDKWTDAKVKGLFIYNQSAYDNVFYIDSINFIDKVAVESGEVFNTSIKGVTIEKDGYAFVPNIIACDNKFVEGVVVELLDGEENVLITATIGEKINLNYAVGTYKLNYAVMIGGVENSRQITVTIVEQKLKGEIVITENYYTNKAFKLPDPVITSSVYSATEIQNAQIKKYYRSETATQWISADGEIIVKNSCAIDLKYTIRVGETVIVVEENTYVHENGVHADFEKWSGGNSYGYKESMASDRIFSVSNLWSHTGKNSLKIHAVDSWEHVSGFVSIASNKDSISFGYQADAIVLWVYSEYNFRDVTIEVDDFNDQWVSGKMQVKAGENRQIVTLSRPIEKFKRIRLTVHGNEPYYIDDISFVKLADIQLPELDGKQFGKANGVTVTKPSFVVNEKYFSKRDIENSSVRIEYETKNGPQVHVFSAEETEVKLSLEVGVYNITYICQVASTEFEFTHTIVVRNFECEFVTPSMLVPLGVEKELTAVNLLTEGATLKVWIKLKGDDWTEIAVTDNKFKLKLDVAGEYQLKYTASKDGDVEEEIYDLLVRKSNSIVDFEINEDGKHVTLGGNYNNKQGYITDSWSKDGKYSYKIKSVGDDFAWVYFMDSNLYFSEWKTEGQMDFPTPQNAISMWIKADWDMPGFKVEILTRTKSGGLYWLKSTPQTIKAGEARYVFTFPNEYEFMYGFGFEVGFAKYDSFCIDAVEYLTVEAEMPTIPESLNQGNTIQIEKPTYKIFGEAQKNVKAYLKNVGDYNFVELAEKDDKFILSVEYMGEITLRLVVLLDDGGEIAYEYQITVYEALEDLFKPDIEWAPLPQ